MNLLPYGPLAVLAEFGSLDEVMRASARWRAASIPAIQEVVPAARTVLVVHDGSLAPPVLRALLESSTGPDGAATFADDAAPVVTVPVRYTGEDLVAVAAACGASIDDIVDWHSSATYTCAFCGFMPGFSYLSGVHPRLQLPRLATPRTRVPAGSVAVANEFSAVYPSASPGGWHLLGITEMSMWDEARDPPATLPPGTRVRFEPT